MRIGFMVMEWIKGEGRSNGQKHLPNNREPYSLGARDTSNILTIVRMQLLPHSTGYPLDIVLFEFLTASYCIDLPQCYKITHSLAMFNAITVPTR